MQFRSFIILVFLFFSGCQTFNDVSENVFNNFSSPKKVKNKIKNPVKDSVKLSALWVGHATVLIQIYDKVILTDPYFTDNIGLLQQRIVEPGVNLKDISRCDLIIISHSHFDHLNIGSLGLIEERFPRCDLVFPSGLEEFLPNYSFKFHSMKLANRDKKIYTGESREINGIKVTTVAAYHWGGRYGLDGLIWGYDSFTGFIIQYKDVTVYFSGDTGYDDKFFKFLGEKYSIDLALVPIGPCKDCEKLHKKNRHVYPKGSLKILEDTKSKLMIPIHYGTVLELSDPDEPKQVLEELITGNTEYSAKVKILKIGEQITIY